MKLFGSDSSFSSTNNSTNIDASVRDDSFYTEAGSIGLQSSGEGNTTTNTITMLDGGSIASAFGFGEKVLDLGAGAFDMIAGADANRSADFENLLDTSYNIFDSNSSSFANVVDTTDSLFGQVFDLSGDNYKNLLNTSSSMMAGILDGMGSAQNSFMATMDTAQSKGTFDNRTITIIGVAIAAVLGVYLFRKGKA